MSETQTRITAQPPGVATALSRLSAVGKVVAGLLAILMLAVPRFANGANGMRDASAGKDFEVRGTNAWDGADKARLIRRLSLLDELFAEGAYEDARLEADLLIAEYPQQKTAVNCVAAQSCISHRPPASERPRQGIGALLSSCVVGFYRAFVGPAIGSRCVLEPSCSQYFLEAGRRHGVVGVPMIADRFIREPVESNSERIMRMPDGSWRHPDPVSDHDWWFSEEPQ